MHGEGEESKGGMDLREDTLQVRKGVAPGSFLDLLMSAKDRTTGKAFTDLELANQARELSQPDTYLPLQLKTPDLNFRFLPITKTPWGSLGWGRGPTAHSAKCRRRLRFACAVLLAAQAFIMMLAGYETTAAALAFTLFLLAAHPDKQQLLVDEVDSFSRDRAPGLGDLERMPYLDACLKEALRLYPPAPTHIREAARDCQLGGYRIRKGQWLGCAVYSMHRNPKYWQVMPVPACLPFGSRRNAHNESCKVHEDRGAGSVNQV